MLSFKESAAFDHRKRRFLSSKAVLSMTKNGAIILSFQRFAFSVAKGWFNHGSTKHLRAAREVGKARDRSSKRMGRNGWSPASNRALAPTTLLYYPQSVIRPKSHFFLLFCSIHISSVFVSSRWDASLSKVWRATSRLVFGQDAERNAEMI